MNAREEMRTVRLPAAQTPLRDDVVTASTDTAHFAHRLAQPAPAWFPHAACRGLDPDLFHPQRGEPTRLARTVCDGCQVRPDCLEYALTEGFKVGMWGGKSEKERRRLRVVRNAA